MTLTLGSGALLAVFGCESKPNKPAMGSSPQPSWADLTPLQKIQRLEFKQLPDIPNFDPTQELIGATTQFYCQEVPCNMSAQELKSRTLFVSVERFLEEYKADLITPLADEEVEQFAAEAQEFVSRKDNIIYMKEEKIQSEVERITATQPEVIKMLAGRDIRVVLMKTILFHASSHANTTTEEVEIEPIEIVPITGRPTVRKIHGFDFEGTYPDGQHFVYTGTNEALTEYTGELVGARTGSFLMGERSTQGAELLKMVNNRAQIEPGVLKEIYVGRRSTEELLGAWGTIKNPLQPNRQAAVNALLTVGIRTNNPEIISQRRAIEVVRGFLGF